MKLPVDAPQARVLKALQLLEFYLVRRGNHLSLRREMPDGTHLAMTLPGHRTIKSSTLSSALSQGKVSRDEFLRAYDQS